jgi:hypothetical protein
LDVNFVNRFAKVMPHQNYTILEVAMKYFNNKKIKIQLEKIQSHKFLIYLIYFFDIDWRVSSQL